MAVGRRPVRDRHSRFIGRHQRPKRKQQPGRSNKAAGDRKGPDPGAIGHQKTLAASAFSGQCEERQQKDNAID